MAYYISKKINYIKKCYFKYYYVIIYYEYKILIQAKTDIINNEQELISLNDDLKLNKAVNPDIKKEEGKFSNNGIIGILSLIGILILGVNYKKQIDNYKQQIE